MNQLPILWMKKVLKEMRRSYCKNRVMEKYDNEKNQMMNQGNKFPISYKN